MLKNSTTPSTTLEARDNLKKLVATKEFQNYHSLESIRLHIALRMKKIREDKNMTQNQLAQKMGVNQSYIVGLESGKRHPNITTLSKFCQAVGGQLEIIY